MRADSTDIDTSFTLLNKFLEGFRAPTQFPTVPKCTEKLRIAINEYNYTFGNYSTPGDKRVEDYIFNFTRVLSN